MELKQFIEEALLNIIEGVEDANSKHNRFRIIGIKRNDSGIDGSNVDFDVSVVVDKKSSGKIEAGGKIDVPFLNVVSTGIDSKLDQTNSQQNINRLKFHIWMSENDLS